MTTGSKGIIPKLATILSRYLILWVFLSMALGILVGYSLPWVSQKLELIVPALLFMMIFPGMTKLELEHLFEVVKDYKKIAVSFVTTFIITPLIVGLFAYIFLRNYPAFAVGFILLGIAPCIGMVLAWINLAGGDNALAAVLVSINSTAQFFTIPFWLYVLAHVYVKVPVLLVVRSVALFVLLPMIAGLLTRRFFLAKLQTEKHEKIALTLSIIEKLAILFAVVVILALQGRTLIAKPWIFLLMALPLLIYYYFVYFVGLGVSRFFRFNYPTSVAIAFNANSTNFEIAIAIAFVSFSSATALATVVGPILELPILVSLIYLSQRLRPAWERQLLD